MNYKIVGGGFSRQVITWPDDEDKNVSEADNAVRKELTQDNTMEHLPPVERARALGTHYLESVGLPSGPFVRQFEPDGSWEECGACWPIMQEDSQGRKPLAARSLDSHIEALGYARDSLPDLAARLIIAAEDMERTERGEYGDADRSERMIKNQLFELGRLIALWGAYLKVSDGRRLRGKSKRRVWADAVATQLREDNLGATKDELWKAIDGLDVIVAGGEQWECYRDGATLVAIRDYDGSEHTLAASTFKKYYLKKG